MIPRRGLAANNGATCSIARITASLVMVNRRYFSAKPARKNALRFRLKKSLARIFRRHIRRCDDHIRLGRFGAFPQFPFVNNRYRSYFGIQLASPP